MIRKDEEEEEESDSESESDQKPEKKTFVAVKAVSGLGNLSSCVARVQPCDKPPVQSPTNHSVLRYNPRRQKFSNNARHGIHGRPFARR